VDNLALRVPAVLAVLFADKGRSVAGAVDASSLAGLRLSLLASLWRRKDLFNEAVGAVVRLREKLGFDGRFGLRGHRAAAVWSCGARRRLSWSTRRARGGLGGRFLVDRSRSLRRRLLGLCLLAGLDSLVRRREITLSVGRRLDMLNLTEIGLRTVRAG
jgi:hypothetical protein